MADPTGSDHIISPGTTAFDLPAGDYQLYLMADGGLVTATLPLAGLTGSLVVHPREPSRLDVRTIHPTLEEGIPPAGLAYSGGDTGEVLTPTAFVFGLLALHTHSVSAGEIGSCVIAGDGPPGKVYAPGCPVSTTPQLTTVYYPTSGDLYLSTTESVLIYDTSKFGPRISQGAWVAGYNGGAAPFLGQIAVWMDLPPLGTSDGSAAGGQTTQGGPVQGAAGLPNSSTGSIQAFPSLRWWLLLGAMGLAARTSMTRRLGRGLLARVTRVLGRVCRLSAYSRQLAGPETLT
ncbi:MAG: hypothetical protein ACYDGR_16750 [Candidatus Dormibacteria bacterium]